MEINIIKIKQFREEELNNKIKFIESQLVSGNKSIKNFVDHELYESALEIKKMSNRINEIIHTIGIINTISKILEANEIIKSISLGSANSNSKFDLITNKRIAEFKFSLWNGDSSNSKRKAEFVKDYLKLIADNSTKQKEFYCFEKEKFENYLLSSRSLIKSIAKDNSGINEIVSKLTSKYNINLTYIKNLKNIPNNKVKIKELNNYL